MTNYERGRNLEYEVAEIFKKAGWDILRGAGSKGEIGGCKVDLVASKGGTKYDKTVYMVLLQAKSVKQ